MVTLIFFISRENFIFLNIKMGNKKIKHSQMASILTRKYGMHIHTVRFFPLYLVILTKCHEPVYFTSFHYVYVRELISNLHIV